jgi:hypothetical protein
MKIVSIYMQSIVDGYEVCIFDENEQMMDFSLTKGFLSTFDEATSYIETLLKNHSLTILNVFYEYPPSFSSYLDHVAI